MAGSGKVNNRKPYNGDRRAVVIAFDVGTTFSGVSYAFLEPGEVPKIHGVTRYPGQEHVTGNTKIPSLLYYDRTGKVVTAGAEAETGQIIDQADDEGWYKVELFKLRLRPRRMELDMNGMRLSPLPPGKSSEDVFGDFLAYLFSCTRKFIEDTHANGKNLWHAVSNDIHFVLSHPNGWEGPQQARMRRAAISGGLIPNTDEGKARIRFVTEGEASMHACILSGLAHDVLASGNGFIVADAGGGTLDVSSYILRGTHPLQIEEVAPPDCVFSGAVFVSRRCRVFLEEKLRSSRYGSPDILDHITKRFDETTKRLFRDKSDPQYIQFGSPLDKDLKVGIRGGQLKLLGTEVADLFEPSIQATVASIRKQIELSRGAVKAVWLVGGFAASSWLFSQLQKRLAPLGVTVNRPDSQTSKAVADGAIGFFCDHHVSARMSRYMYGVEYLREIDVNDEEHLTRSGRQLQLPSGPKYLPDAFDCILAKNVRVKESSVFSRKYYTEVTKLSTLSVFEIEIWCYRGGETIPRWIDRNSDQFGSLCFVRADLSRLSNSAEPKKGANGQTYWTVVFTIEIHFGLTEFKARMKWNEDGKTKYGPATIVYNEKGVRSDEDDGHSVAGGDESTSVSPRRPYGSLLNHSSRDASSATRSSRHTTDHGIQRDRSHRARAPPLPGPGMSRSMSGQTDASVETVIHDPSPPLSAPPVTSSVSGSVRRSSRSRGVGSAVPSAHELEPEPPLERERESSLHSREPSLHSRAPSMYSRAPPGTAAMSSHSRGSSTVLPPSVHSRTPSVAASPSMHSRAPSAAAPLSMHSRAPSAAAPPSTQSRTPSFAQSPSVAHSRTPSVAPAESPVVSRAPSFAPAVSAAPPSRAPSATRGVSPASSHAPLGAPAASRLPSAGSGRSVSRAPSSGSRVPIVTRQSSSRSGPGSRVPSHMGPVDEGDMYVNTEPDVTGSAAEYFNTHSNPLDGSRSKSRSISPAPPVGEVPQHGDWETEIPTVSIVPPSAEDKKDKPRGWDFGNTLGSMFGSNSKQGEATDPLAASSDVPLESFGNAEEPFVPQVPGGASWCDVDEAPAASGGWGAEPPVPKDPSIHEPEVTVPPVGKSSSSKSTASKKKQPKGILKNGSAQSAWNDGFGATMPAPGGWEDVSAPPVQEPAVAAAAAPEPPAPAPEPEPIVPEPEVSAPPITKTTSGKSGKGNKKNQRGVSKNGTASSKTAEAEAKAKEEGEARQKAAEAEAARANAEADELARVKEEQDRIAREQEEMARLEKELAEQEAARQREAAQAAEWARLQAEAEQKAKEEEERLAQFEREEAAARERGAREREEAEIRAKAQEEKARLEAEAAAAAEMKANEEAEAAAKANAEAEAANAATQEQEHGEEGRRGADADAGAADAGAPSAAAVDDEKKAKLQEAVEKAEKDFEKAESELNKTEAELSKVQKAPAKGGKKKTNKSGPSPAEKAKEREVQVAKTKMDAAKAKLESAKAELAAYAGSAPTAEATDPPSAQAEEPEDPVPDFAKDTSAAGGKKKKDKKKNKNATVEDDDQNEAENPSGPPAFEDPPEFLPPISKASSNANGKGKKSLFSAEAFGIDDGAQAAEDKEGENEGEERNTGGEPIAEGLFGGSNNTGFNFGGGWGLGTSIGIGNKSANKSGGKTGGWFDF